MMFSGSIEGFIPPPNSAFIYPFELSPPLPTLPLPTRGHRRPMTRSPLEARSLIGGSLTVLVTL